MGVLHTIVVFHVGWLDMQKRQCMVTSYSTYHVMRIWCEMFCCGYFTSLYFLFLGPSSLAKTWTCLRSRYRWPLIETKDNRIDPSHRSHSALHKSHSAPFTYMCINSLWDTWGGSVHRRIDMSLLLLFCRILLQRFTPPPPPPPPPPSQMTFSNAFSWMKIISLHLFPGV